MRLVSLLTENYLERARPFLRSLEKLSGVDRWIIGLGFHSPPQGQTSRVRYACMPRHRSESSPGIMQHGRWLDALPDVQDDEVCLLSDADIVVQRDFTPEERQFFEFLGENEYAAGWNGGEHDNLLEEAKRIGLAPEAVDLMQSDIAWSKIPCWNTGVLAMRGRSWKRLRDLYESRCERFYRLTLHRSRGQWFICFCLHRLGMQAKILPGQTHLHGHLGMPSGGEIREGVAYYRNKVVLFRHAL